MRRENCREVQRDPYGNLLSNYERQVAKQLPLRMFFNGLAMGGFAIYYLSRSNEIHRIRKLRFTVDMMLNAGARAVAAGVFTDIVTRHLFVNYDRIQAHKVANNEVRKIMRTFPNARPMLKPHEKPNSYYYAR